MSGRLAVAEVVRPGPLGVLPGGPGAGADDPSDGGEASSLWRAYELVASGDERMAMRKVSHRRDIYPVFRELFSREGAKAEA